MYLARQLINGKIHFFIRESYRHDTVYRSRNLFDLGNDPRDFIIYPGRNSFYIDETVEDALASQDIESDLDELEDIFWPFLKLDVQRALETFRHKSQRRGLRGKMSAEEKEAIQATVHPFDKRRMHYLRLGAPRQGNIVRTPASVLRVLTHKSRDEIEQNFLQMEATLLKPPDIKTYVYIIFDIQRFFKKVFASEKPYMLDQDDVDNFFLDEICKLNRDTSFWAGETERTSLHDYLVRYPIMFFDYGYGPGATMQDYIRDFMRRHRFYRPLTPKSTFSYAEAAKVFDIAADTLKDMSHQELTRLYRRRAHELHPDVGGGHEDFCKLTEAYKSMIQKKKVPH